MFFIVIGTLSFLLQSLTIDAAVTPKINIRSINDTIIFNVSNAKSKDTISFNLYYKVDGEYTQVGGKEIPEIGTRKSHMFLGKNGDYAMTVSINNGKESNKVTFRVNSIKKETGEVMVNEWDNKNKEQIMYGISSEFKGIYTISPVNPPENKSITMRMYTIKNNKFSLKYTQKVSPGQQMEIPRLKGIREYAFTYSVDGNESDYHVFLYDSNNKYIEDDFIVNNYTNMGKSDPKETVVKSQTALKSALVSILSKKKDAFVTIDNKVLEKYFKQNQFPDALLTKLFPNKSEKAKYKKLLNKYHCWRSDSKKHDALEIHLFPIKSYVIDR